MDEDLRELERAAQRGDPGARLRLLAARRRAGRLDEERLEFAARLGDADARALLEVAASAEAEHPLAWLESVREQPWALEVTLLTAAVGARAALAAFERDHPEDRGPRRCVEAAEAFVACPCDTHAEQARVAGEWQERASFERSRRTRHLVDGQAAAAGRAAIFVAKAAGLREVPDRARMVAVVAMNDAFAAAHPQVRGVTCAALSRWLLGV